MYVNLRKGLPKDSERNAESVHYLMIPEVDTGAIDETVELRVQRLQQTIDLGRKAREAKNLKTKVCAVRKYEKPAKMRNFMFQVLRKE